MGEKGSNPLDYEAIRNIIAQYCFALDTKQFGQLENVFTADVDAIYPFRGAFKGVENVIEAIKKRLTPVTTQHALTTQHIHIEGDGNHANAITYFTGIHFGRGKWEGQQVTAWGKYVDRLVLVEDAGVGVATAVEGASGAWRIERREVTFMGRLGEEGVMDGE